MKKNVSCKKLNNKTSIGGQAVLEGVMMRSSESMAIAVRDADGIVRLETKRLNKGKKSKIKKIPFIRGIISFISSLFDGTKVLMRSADVYGESEPSRFEKWLSEKLKINIMSVVSFFSILLGLGLAILLFVFIPVYARELIEKIIGNGFKFENLFVRNLIEGGFKLLIFIGYILFCSAIKDVRRTFMYHGAEHKTISCYEKGLELTVSNAKKCSRIHDRCGTTFMVLVMLISIIVFACFEAVSVNYLSNIFQNGINGIVRVLCKVILLPLIAGISYEVLKALSKTNCFLVYPLKVPGFLLQKITTKEPDDNMLEVAITAFKAVMELDKDPTLKECNFVIPEKIDDLLKRVSSTLSENGIDEYAEVEWIVSLSCNVKRDELSSLQQVSPKYIDKINSVLKERITGRPLWYCIGDTEFYGYKIKVDERVLIPRPETELLVYNALPHINSDSEVLDLCTGSGAIAIAVKGEKGANVVGSDISQDALSLANENAILNNVNIEFVHGDLFEAVMERKFDVIFSNPPYIKSSDINSLQNEVKNFEPILALDGGEDGLDFYRKIVSQVKNYLKPNGVVFLECGFGQAQIVKEMFDENFSVEIIKDYENIDRIVKAVFNV